MWLATGSSTCSIVMVAAGEMDIYWDAGCYAWDVAVSSILHSFPVQVVSGSYCRLGQSSFLKLGGSFPEERKVLRGIYR